LIELFKLMKGLSFIPWSHFFKKAEDASTRGHTWKLAKKHCRCDSRLYFFSQRVIINRWNKLSQEDVDAQSINCFKNRLEKGRTRRWWGDKVHCIRSVGTLDVIMGVISERFLLRLRRWRGSVWFIISERNSLHQSLLLSTLVYLQYIYVLLQYRSTRSTSVLIRPLRFNSQHANPHRPQHPIIA